MLCCSQKRKKNIKEQENNIFEHCVVNQEHELHSPSPPMIKLNHPIKQKKLIQNTTKSQSQLKELQLIGEVRVSQKKTTSPFQQFKQFSIVEINYKTEFRSHKMGYTLYVHPLE